jgi:hypothetical protein
MPTPIYNFVLMPQTELHGAAPLFQIGTTAYRLVGVQFWNGSNHYMAAVQDTDQQWWYFTGLGHMQRTGSLHGAIEHARSSWFISVQRRIQPTLLFYVAVR